MPSTSPASRSRARAPQPTISASALLNSPINGKGGHSIGVEVGRHAAVLDVYVSALDGLRRDRRRVVHQDQDQHHAGRPRGGHSRAIRNGSPTAPLFFEKWGFNARGSVRYRSTFLGELSGFGGEPRLVDRARRDDHRRADRLRLLGGVRSRAVDLRAGPEPDRRAVRHAAHPATSPLPVIEYQTLRPPLPRRGHVQVLTDRGAAAGRLRRRRTRRRRTTCVIERPSTSSSSAAAPPAGWRRRRSRASSATGWRDHAGRIRRDRHGRRRRGDDPADPVCSTPRSGIDEDEFLARDQRARSSSASSSSTGRGPAQPLHPRVRHDRARARADAVPPLLAARAARWAARGDSGDLLAQRRRRARAAASRADRPRPRGCRAELRLRLSFRRRRSTPLSCAAMPRRAA